MYHSTKILHESMYPINNGYAGHEGLGNKVLPGGGEKAMFCTHNMMMSMLCVLMFSSCSTS